jgi:ribosomal protein L29
MAKTTEQPATEKDLQAKLAELRKELSDARRSLAANELPNPRVVNNTRREIARTLTAINAAKTKTKKEVDNA